LEEKPQILQWSVPEFPYRVTIPTPVMNEARILAVEAFYSVPRGGVEIGGVWFGTREADALHICAHRPIRCQYFTGPSFTLSVNDQLGLSGLLEAAPSDPELYGMTPLGWYHSHTRSDIFLSPADLQLYNEFFPEKWQFAMVLKPANLQPTRGGFFFRDRSGAIKADAPAQEFRLEPPCFGLTPLDSAGAAAPVAAEPSPAHARVAAPVSPPVAASIAASGPELATARLAKSEPAPQTAAIPVPERHRMDLMEVLAPDPPERLSVAAAVAKEEGSAQPPSPAAEPEEKSEPPEPSAVEIPRFLVEPKTRTRRRTGWVWGLAALILLCGAGGGAVMKWGVLARPMDLGLETYDINGSFLIRWDRDSKLFRGATRVTLEIQDGGEKTPIELTAPEIERGGYGYMRRTGQVAVHMVVQGLTPAEEYSNFTSAESLGSQPAPIPQGDPKLAQVLAEKEHLKTELINESMQSLDLRREIQSLRRQLAEERAKNTSAPAQ
jgi:proteasome lid subunit RPN8/RPN11